MLGSNSPLFEEMSKIMESEEDSVNYTWEIEFKVKDTFKGEFKQTDRDLSFLDDDEKNDKIFKPMKVTNIDYKDDYEKGIMREIWARVVIPFGMWAKCLFIARDHISCIVRRTALKAITFEKDEEVDIEEFVYDTLFHVDESNSMTGVDYTNICRTDLDNSYAPAIVNVELLDRSVELTRKVTVGGPYRNVKPEDCIKNILTYFTKDLEVDGEKAIKTISMVEANNKDKREHILIPHGFPLLDVPNFIQENCGGVYNSNLNCYSVGDKIYVYPIYQTDRFEKEKKTLTVVRINTKTMPQVERTYKLDGDALFILGMSDATFKDISIAKKLNSGNGVRFTDSRKFLNGFVETKDNKSKADRKKVNNEYKAEDMKEQDTVFVSNNRITSNTFRERSKLAVRNGASFTFQWPNSKPELLYPGMPVKVLYDDAGDVLEMRGVIMGAHTSIALIGDGLTSNKHGTTTAINLFALPYDGE